MRYEKNGCSKLFPLLLLYERYIGILIYEELVNHNSFMPIEDHRKLIELRIDSHARILETLMRHGFLHSTPGGIGLTDKGVCLHGALEYVAGLLDDFVPASELEANE